MDQQEKAAGQKCKSKAQTCQTILKMPVKMSGEEKEEKKNTILLLLLQSSMASMQIQGV